MTKQVTKMSGSNSQLVEKKRPLHKSSRPNQFGDSRLFESSQATLKQRR